MRSVFRIRNILAGAVPVVLCSLLLGQSPRLETKNGRQFPTVVFTSVFWTADPAYYSVAIDSSGATTYQSAPNSVEQTGVPYTVEFAVTDRTLRATFNLVRSLNFLREDVPHSIGSPQNTFVRTLAFYDGQVAPAVYDGQVRNQITYSTSPNSDMQELTSVFEELSETLEFGRRLIYLHDHDRNALGPELEKLQTSADQHHVREPQALITVLRSIASDRKIDDATRRLAENLLNRARLQNASRK